jgi:hypothetical protein
MFAGELIGLALCFGNGLRIRSPCANLPQFAYLLGMNLFRKTSFLLGLAFACSFAQDWDLDRPYTLRTLNYLPLLNNLHQQALSGGQDGIFPRRDSLWRKDLPKNPLFSWKGDGGYLAGSIVGGYEYRASKSLGDTIKAMDGGLLIRGYKDSVEFWLDARIYNEDHSAKNPRSWDREFLEVQDSVNGDISYTSYARYRGHISAHLGWTRIDAGRDAVHWGPGYWGNLTFNQQGIPFPQLSMETTIGPLTVKSLYGDLLVSPSSMDRLNTRDRNLYAHRYEFQATKNLMIAINEQTIIDSINEPILFIPIVPQFMQKGQMSEEYNNGTLSMDFCYRKPGWFRVYSEFLLDDMASPVSLFKNDNVEAKWAYMGGVHFVRNFGPIESGFISEYARVEPWVYTHFNQNTAQVAHQGLPLGNPLGPNSQSIDAMVYGRFNNRLFGSLRTRWWWKGTDYGSQINDETPSSNHFDTPKSFLHDTNGDVVDMNFTLAPSFSYTYKYVGMQLELNFFDNPGVYARLGLQW